MKLISILALTLLAAVSAMAQPYDATWVSHSGVDGSFCGVTTNPCRTFAMAVSNTVSGGIIRAMDAGEYGGVQISQPIVIDGNGVGFIDVTTSGSTGAYVLNSVGVEIRNLDIHIAATCLSCYGIQTSNSTVSIENVSIIGMPQSAVYSAGGAITVHRLTVTGSKNNGIYAQDVTGTISDTIVRNSGFGIYLIGVNVATQVMVERSKMISNTTGLLIVNGGAATTGRISDCVITNNTTGVSVSGGQLITFRNNTWAGNGTDGSTSFSASLK